MRWGNVFEHARTMEPITGRGGRRLCWRCREMGVKKRATHTGCANGLGMMSACEWHVRQWVKDPRA